MAKKARVRERAIAELLSGSTVEKAAAACGIHKRTLLRWLRDPAFKEDYERARQQVLDAALARLRSKAESAVTTLAEVCEDSDAPTPSRVAAAGKILDTNLRVHELHEIEARIQKLEEQTSERT